MGWFAAFSDAMRGAQPAVDMYQNLRQLDFENQLKVKDRARQAEMDKRAQTTQDLNNQQLQLGILGEQQKQFMLGRARNQQMSPQDVQQAQKLNLGQFVMNKPGQQLEAGVLPPELAFLSPQYQQQAPVGMAGVQFNPPQPPQPPQSISGQLEQQIAAPGKIPAPFSDGLFAKPMQPPAAQHAATHYFGQPYILPATPDTQVWAGSVQDQAKADRDAEAMQAISGLDVNDPQSILRAKYYVPSLDRSDLLAREPSQAQSLNRDLLNAFLRSKGKTDPSQLTWDEGQEFEKLNADAKRFQVPTLPPEVVNWAANQAALGDYGPMRSLSGYGVQSTANRIQIGAGASSIQEQRGMSTTASKSLLSNLQKQLDSVSVIYAKAYPWSQTAEKNLQLFVDRLQQLGDSGSPVLNENWRKIGFNWLGDPNVAAMLASRKAGLSETVRVLSSANGGGAVAQEFRDQIDTLIPEGATFGMALSTVKTLMQEMHNRNTSYAAQIQQYTDLIKNFSATLPTAPDGSYNPGAGSTNPSVVDFKSGQDTTGANGPGKPITFNPNTTPNQSTGPKQGETRLVNGITYTWGPNPINPSQFKWNPPGSGGKQ